MQRPLPEEEYSVKEISPHLGGGGTTSTIGDKLVGSNDLVEQMEYFFVWIVKAKNLPPKDITGSCNPYVEVRHGNYKGTTSHFEQKTDPEWNQVFVFSTDQIQASTIEILVKDKHVVKDDFIGMVVIYLNQIIKRVRSDSPLAPRRYWLEDPEGNKVNGGLILTVWLGTQTDEAFPEARHLDAETVSGDSLVNTGSQVYHSPKLWYVRLQVIEARDLQVDLKAGYPEVFAKARIGDHVRRTRISQNRNENPLWNEEIIFVAAEPFDEPLVISVEERLGSTKDEVLGKTDINLQNVERRLSDELVAPQWYNLQKHVVNEGDQRKKEVRNDSRIRLRIALEGGYHVFDESTHYNSDLRPSAEQLWNPSIGVLELGILSACKLLPMKDGRGTTDAYCVAKYGQKWVRTRTVKDSLSPRWNEQYSWEVYDPHTVITIGVFDNCLSTLGSAKDGRIGKVRIRLSTLETDRVYTHIYPLLLLLPSGLKKTGEIHLAVRFRCSSMLRMMRTYTQPLLPKMHYIRPLTVLLLDNLRHRAMQIVSATLSRAEPPLRREVIEYMLDVDSHMWSMRRSKANFFRITTLISPFIAAINWFDQICNWKNPRMTIVVHLVFLILVLYPDLIFPAIFLYLVLQSVENRRFRPRIPVRMNSLVSQAVSAHPDELDEEFDSFPTSRPSDVVRMRYDRLRSVAGRMQTVFGDLATQGERLQSLSSWRDPRASDLFAIFCLLAAIMLYLIGPRVPALLTGFYAMRHPRFRHGRPSVLLNFFRRLPGKEDALL